MSIRNALCTALALYAANLSAADRIPIQAGKVPQALHGTWQSNGYGLITQLGANGSALYEYTATRCWSAREESAEMIAYVDHYRLSADRSRLQLFVVGEPHAYQFARLAALPTRCLQPAAADTGSVLATFIDVMDTHYAFFERYGVDWSTRGRQAQKELHENSVDQGLFEIMRRSLSGITDGHLELSAGDEDRSPRHQGNHGATLNRVSARASESNRDPRAARLHWKQRIWQLDIAKNLLQSSGSRAGNNFLQYGIVSDDIGYFAAYAVGGYASRQFDDPAADVRVLEAALDDALTQFEKAAVKAVVLDLSLNQGGFKFIARALASRFVADRRLAYSKSPADAQRPYSTELWITPASGHRYEGPVYVLSSDITISAGEIALLSLRPYPNVTHVGARTRGALSDVLGKVLPNGWSLSLSNEAYLDHEGVSWEGRGIEPQIAIDVFPVDNLDQGHRLAMDQLIMLIDEQIDSAEHAR